MEDRRISDSDLCSSCDNQNLSDNSLSRPSRIFLVDLENHAAAFYVPFSCFWKADLINIWFEMIQVYSNARSSLSLLYKFVILSVRDAFNYGCAVVVRENSDSRAFHQLTCLNFAN